MISKPWDDSDIVNISADLDKELREIFADMEAVLGKPRNPVIEDASCAPTEDFLVSRPEDEQPDARPRNPVRPDETAGNIGATDEDEPDEVEFLPDEFELPATAVDFSRPVNGVASAAQRINNDDEEFYHPADRAAQIIIGKSGWMTYPEEEESPGSEALAEEEKKERKEGRWPKLFPDNRPGSRKNFSDEFSYADTVAELRPDDLFRLIERAVIKGLSRALKKSGR